MTSSRQVNDTLSIVSHSIVPINPFEQYNNSIASERQNYMEPKIQNVQVVSNQNANQNDNDYLADALAGEVLASQVKTMANFKKYTQQHQRS